MTPEEREQFREEEKARLHAEELRKLEEKGKK